MTADGCAGIGEAAVEGEGASTRHGAVHVHSRGASHALGDALTAFFGAVGLCRGAGSLGSVGVLAGRTSGAACFAATVSRDGSCDALAVCTHESLGAITIAFASGLCGGAFSGGGVAGVVGDGLGGGGAGVVGAGGEDLDAACAALSARERGIGGFDSALVVAANGCGLCAGVSVHGARGVGGFGGGYALSEVWIAGVEGCTACAAACGGASGALTFDGCAGIGQTTKECADASTSDGGVEVSTRGAVGILGDTLTAFLCTVGLCGGADSVGAIGILAGFTDGATFLGAAIGGFGTSDTTVVGTHQSLGAIAVGFAASGEGSALSCGSVKH